MEFKKYQHVERFGTEEVRGIENGMCYIFPKLDGTNGQLWWDGKIKAGSRNRELSEESDNAGFYEWAKNSSNIHYFFRVHPELKLFGEWLVPHTLRTYTKNAWRRFYVFDVMDSEGNYIPYETYKEILNAYDIDYIPPICKIENPSYERLVAQLEKNTFLIEDGKGSGEGIVIKNYDYRNKYGRVTWAKIVKNEFKEIFHKKDITEIKESKIIEQEIAEKYVTLALVEKEFSKISLEGWTSKQIPRLLNTVYYCLITEEIWNALKEFKSPVIDFKRLIFFTNNRIKELMPQLF